MPKLNKTLAKKAREAEGLGALEAGTYLGILNKVTEKEGRESPYWEWEFSIVGTEEGEEIKGGRLWENTSLSERALWRLKDMFGSFGVELDTDTNELIGQYIWLVVGTEIQAEGAGAGKERNILLSTMQVE